MQSLCNRAGTVVATAAVAAAFQISPEIHYSFARFAKVLQENAIFQFIRTTYGNVSSKDLMDDLVDSLLQRHRVPPYLIASMHASISKSDTRNAQRTLFGRFTHLRRLFASLSSLKNQKKVMFLAMLLFLRY